MIGSCCLLAIAVAGPVARGDFVQPAADQALKIETVVYTRTETRLKKGEPPDVNTVTEYFRPGATRMENPTGGVLIVADGTMLVLRNDPRRGGRYSKEPFPGKLGGPEELLALYLREKDEHGKPVGHELVDGITARKYEMQFGEPGAGKGTLWIDPKTGFPVKLHYAAADGSHVRTVEKFRWNAKLDPKLFSLDPPPGYQPAEEKKK